MTSLSSIPPAPREPTPRARELIFKYQGAQKGMLLIGVIFALFGGAFCIPFAWGVPIDLMIATTGAQRHGRVISTQVDTSISSNGRHPTTIRFFYTTVDGQRFETESSSWGSVPAADEPVPIQVSSLNPAWARVAGTTRAPFGYGALFVLVFPLVGLLLAGFAVRSNRREIRAFTHGEATEGKVVYFGADRSTRINGRNPFKVDWEFRVGEGIFTGSLSSMRMLALEELGKQETIVVLYDPVDPSINTAWVG